MGTKGIEVSGSTRSEKIELEDLPPEISEDWARSHEEDTERVEVYRPRLSHPPAIAPQRNFSETVFV